MKKRDNTFYIVLLIKSILMGTVNKLPGVSGGLVALLTGFYIEMINSLRKINLKIIPLIFKLNFSKINKNYNGLFLFIILTGIVISYFTTSKLLDFLFNNYELFVWSAFFGMILASNFILIQNLKNWDFNSFIPIISGLILGLIISFTDPIEENKNLMFIFFCGFISVSGMIIPGLSGSFLLILLGNYKLLLIDSVNSLYNSLLILIGIESNISHNLELLKIVLVFTLGSILGLILLSNFLSYLIRKHEETVNQFIIGFVFGSLIILWPWNHAIEESLINDNLDITFPKLTEITNIISIIWICIGLITVLSINNYVKKKN
ncbi:MAG: DUF368 domain-containing protein [Flavobacteriales bacterium]|nr:DUF368 domain-containing protein [Flavobacteriaceae bacterium]RZP09525.1 MAG: DUF368 domain-containing protein [Flavobacteriales bacterium]